MIAISLFVLGLCAASFVNALVWRIKNKKDFVRGRSQCVHCGHQLAGKDLVPVLSWLSLKGRCRYCKKPISAQYPIVELVGGLVFALSYLFWPGDLGDNGNIILFFGWILSSIGLMALAVYDLKWMLLPNKILYPTFFVVAAADIVYLIGFADNRLHLVLSWVASVAVASGVFLVLFIVSQGRWIGYGDVRLGLISGSLLLNPALSFLMIFLASILGLIFVLPSMLRGKTSMASKLPYGPFLIVATGVCILFGQALIDWYTNLFLPG